VQDKQFKFLAGGISYWEPDWSTTLVYGGDTKALNAFLHKLTQVRAVRVRVTFANDLAKEHKSAYPAGSWSVQYKHTAPDMLAVRINLAAEGIDPENLDLPLAEREPDPA
jgi:hypothetical protein